MNFRVLFLFIVCVLLSMQSIGQADSAYTVMDGELCNGRFPDGEWFTTETWEASGDLTVPPGETWQGKKVIISNDIIICNNKDVNLSESAIDTIILRANASITYRANATLMLPCGAIIIMEENTVIKVKNQSQGTLLQICGVPLWGKQVGCTDNLLGPMVIDSWSDLCNLTPLPVELGSYEVYAKQDHISLEWSTLSEINADLFEIYRSSDAINWTSIGVVDAVGWSTTIQHYEWKDYDVLPQTNYYKIRQVDNDGKFTWFPVKHATLAASYEVAFNNPVSDWLVLSLNVEKAGVESADITIRIIDSNGVEQFRSAISSGTYNRVKQFDISMLRNGIYFMVLENGNELMYSGKLIKY